MQQRNKGGDCATTLAADVGVAGYGGLLDHACGERSDPMTQSEDQP